VEDLRVPSFLARDLPIRRKQAALGVVSAQGAVTRAEGETVYGVTFSYLSALYAVTQRQVAANAQEDLEFLHEQVQKALKQGLLRHITQLENDKVGIRLLRTRARAEEARQGEQRALSALREALGVGPECPLVLADRELFDADQAVDLPQVVAAALERRGEVIQTANAAQVTAYEVDAQCARLLPSARTFAASADIHAQPVPPGSYGENYRPGAIPPEMPAMLNGSRGDRAEQARLYAARAKAVADKTRQLVALEAEQAYFRWLEARNREKHYRSAVPLAERQFDRAKKRTQLKDLPAGSIDDFLYFGQQHNEVRIEANLARYQKLLALAILERVTAGGFCPAFGVRPDTPPADSRPAGKGE
jgi:outer membrane protein TolC